MKKKMYQGLLTMFIQIEMKAFYFTSLQLKIPQSSTYYMPNIPMSHGISGRKLSVTCTKRQIKSQMVSPNCGIGLFAFTDDAGVSRN